MNPGGPAWEGAGFASAERAEAQYEEAEGEEGEQDVGLRAGVEGGDGVPAGEGGDTLRGGQVPVYRADRFALRCGGNGRMEEVEQGRGDVQGGEEAGQAGGVGGEKAGREVGAGGEEGGEA